MALRRPTRKRVLPDGKSVRPRGDRPSRRGLTPPAIETEAGILVRSQPEKICAEFLHQLGVEFRYEPLMLVGGRQVRPDFYLPRQNLFIEICGYNHMPHYRRRVEEKKKLYLRHKVEAVFIDYKNVTKLRQELGRIIDTPTSQPGD